MRYFVYFSYDGTAYHGWQVQPNAETVQQKLNEALSILLRENVETVGAGRTDTGVHASAMTAHFDTNAEVNETSLVDKLNRLLPQDIAVSQIKRVADDVHARFDAVARTYHYHVYTGKDPFLRHYATRLYYEPDYDLMNLAAEQLLQYTETIYRRKRRPLYPRPVGLSGKYTLLEQSKQKSTRMGTGIKRNNQANLYL